MENAVFGSEKVSEAIFGLIKVSEERVGGL